MLKHFIPLNAYKEEGEIESPSLNFKNAIYNKASFTFCIKELNANSS